MSANTSDLAPRFHHLVRLAEWTWMYIEDRYLDVLAEMTASISKGAIPTLRHKPTLAEAQMYIVRTEEAREWLTRQLFMSFNAI